MNDERSTINDRDRLTSHYIPPVRILLIVDRSSFFYLFHVTFSFLLRLAYVNGTKTIQNSRDKLLSYARKLTDDHSDAEDAVQEVMLKLWNLRPKLDEYHSIEALAMTMTHHTCMDILRGKHPDNLSLDSVQAASPVATPERLLEEKDEFSLMRHIISTLPPLQQTILRMKDVEEYETEEIAEITGCSSEAIRSNLSRARKKVRDIYLQTIQQRKRRNEA